MSPTHRPSALSCSPCSGMSTDWSGICYASSCHQVRGGGAVQWDEYGLVGDLLRFIMPLSEGGGGHYMPQHVSTSGPGWTALGDVFCPLFLPSKPGPTLLSFVAKGACPRASNVPALTPLPRNLQARWMSLAPNPSGSDSTRRQPAGAVLPS